MLSAMVPAAAAMPSVAGNQGSLLERLLGLMPKSLGMVAMFGRKMQGQGRHDESGGLVVCHVVRVRLLNCP